MVKFQSNRINIIIISILLIYFIYSLNVNIYWNQNLINFYSDYITLIMLSLFYIYNIFKIRKAHSQNMLWIIRKKNGKIITSITNNLDKICVYQLLFLIIVTFVVSLILCKYNSNIIQILYSVFVMSRIIVILFLPCLLICYINILFPVLSSLLFVLHFIGCIFWQLPYENVIDRINFKNLVYFNYLGIGNYSNVIFELSISLLVIYLLVSLLCIVGKILVKVEHRWF